MHCILTNTKEYQTLKSQVNTDERTLKAAIAVWQEDNGLDNWPTSSDINKLLGVSDNKVSALENKLKQWFNVAGVQYTPVEDLELNGEQVIARADVLRGILEVVEGRRDASTLAEEAAHFLVEMLPVEHPILKTMMATVDKTEMYAKVVEEYGEAYEYNEDKLKKEVIGKLIAQEVMSMESQTTESPVIKSKFAKFVDGILSWLKVKFKFLSSNTVYQEVEAYKTAAELILSANKTSELIEAGSLKKYSESNWNGKESEYYYQVSADATAIRDGVISNLDIKRAKIVDGIYYTPQGKPLARRASDFVEDFYAKVFKTKDLTDEESVYRKLKGTYIHKIAQIYITSRLKGLPITEAGILGQAKTELLAEDEKFTAAFKERGNELWSLGNEGYSNLRKGLEELLAQIEKKNKSIKDITGITDNYKIYSEVSIYDESEGVAGTIDLLVVYPNGTVGIYDYKSMNFGYSKEISSTKIEAFQIQLDWYKKLLVQNYGVRDFAESRIVPIDVRLDKDGKVYTVNMSNEDYLAQIPIKEFTGNKKFDEELDKLYKYADSLRAKVRKNYQDEGIKLRLFRIEKAIRSVLINKELKYLDSELTEMSKELETRSMIDSASPEGNPLTDEDINEMNEFVAVIKGAVSRFSETLGKDITPEQSQASEILIGKLTILENKLRDKTKEFINKVNPNEDINTPHKELGFFSRIFSPTFEINSPIIKKLQKLIQDMSYSVVSEVNDLISKIEVKRDNLEKWADSKGISLMDAYKLIINEDTGNLVSRLSSEYYKSRREAIDKGGLDKQNWFNKYHTFDKEAYTTALAKKIKAVNEQFPGKYKVKLRESKITEFEKKYNVDKYDSAISENNRFLKINEDTLPKNFFNAKWINIYAKGNEALKEFYESYIKYNEEFAAITGRDINKTFIAEIRKDALSRATSNGIGSLFNVKNIFLEMLEVRQDDVMSGSFDPTTGEAIQAIPLLYTDDLMSRLTKSELRGIEEEASKKYSKGSDEYIELAKNLTLKLQREKGLKTKSYDLTHSLILFAKSAYTFKHLSESEAYVKNLKYYIESGGGKRNLTDGADVPLVDRFTRKVMTVSGVPHDEIELMENIINGVWYGRSILDKDKIFNEKSVTDSEGNVIGRTTGFSRNKAVRNTLSYVAIKSLGLNPFSAVGNYIGTRSNLYMLATEGNIINGKSLRQAVKNAYSDRKRYMAASEILQPYSHSMINEMANNLSATKLERLITVDNLFVLMKKPDEQIDRLLTNALLQSYGLDSEGKIKHLNKLPKDSMSLLDYLKEDSTGNWSFEGVSNEELAKFRVIIYKKANKIKGSVPEHMKAGFSRTLTGQVMMQFRGWMPGLISARFKDTSYDPDLDELDAGKFRVFWGEVFNSGSFGAGVKEFTTLMADAITGGYIGGLKKTNIKATQIAFDKFKLTNPEEAKGLTIEDFVELRTAKLKGMAAELRMYFLMAMLMLLAKAMIPDDDKDSIERFWARNAYLAANRGFLELSFFLQPSSVRQILKSPIPSMQLIWDGEALLRNTFSETYEAVSGDIKKNDKSPWTYYFVTRFTPLGKPVADVFDVYDAFKTK